MSDDGEEVDPERLQRQLADIKGAIGLADEYPGHARLWLFVGVLVVVLALVTQATLFLDETFSSGDYALIWLGFVAFAVAAGWWMASRLPSTLPPEVAPSWRGIFGALAAFAVAVTALSQRIGRAVDGLERASFFFAFAIALIGLALLLTGTVLKTYRVRSRDRRVFHAGGAWVLAYASVYPHVEFLRCVGVGVFGVGFLLYATAAYTPGRDSTTRPDTISTGIDPDSPKLCRDDLGKSRPGVYVYLTRS